MFTSCPPWTPPSLHGRCDLDSHAGMQTQTVFLQLKVTVCEQGSLSTANLQRSHGPDVYSGLSLKGQFVADLNMTDCRVVQPCCKKRGNANFWLVSIHKNYPSKCDLSPWMWINNITWFHYICYWTVMWPCNRLTDLIDMLYITQA